MQNNDHRQVKTLVWNGRRRCTLCFHYWLYHSRALSVSLYNISFWMPKVFWYLLPSESKSLLHISNMKRRKY